VLLVSDRFVLATEEELYAEISRAWYRLSRCGDHVKRPMRPYALGPEFAQAVWSTREDKAQCVIAVCARIITFPFWELPGARLVGGVDYRPKEALDPVTAWWQPVDELSGYGVHCWILGNGTIELRSLAAVDDPPLPEYRRFADRLGKARI
jgi:hypothetical protein